MKSILPVFLGLFSTAAIAGTDGFVVMQPNIKKAPTTMQVPTNLKGELACDLYKFRVENGGLKESTLLVSRKIGVTPIGSYLSAVIPFPAPFDNYAVGFNHAMVSYAETDDGFLPYIQGFFLVDGSPDIVRFGSSKDVRFDISAISEGSKLVLRGFYRVGPEALLTYRCSIRFF
jgi:hypothetical protein